MLSGGWLDFSLVLMGLWIVLLCWTFWKLFSGLPRVTLSRFRNRLTIAGLGFSIVALSALFTLHLSWLSAGVSQRLGIAAIRILSLLVFWPTLAGLILSLVGSGKMRLLGVGTSLAMGFWWLNLSIDAAISMGPPIVRHPVRFLIPDGYVGWVKVRYSEHDATPLEMENGTFICRIPYSGVLSTSSQLEEGWAKDEYFYYREDGSVRPLKDTGWGQSGMIWGEKVESEQPPVRSEPMQFAESFYVGTEEQFDRGVSEAGHQ